ncbi:WD40 repeat domain-containing protein [Methanofollis aquaemaris]|nr:PQQ-binding-like beta-propeller repeat protein [Methanofollis aquaemaris]
MAPLWICLLLACLPAGVLAEEPLWNLSVPSAIGELTMTPDGSYVLTNGERLCFLTGNGTVLWTECSAEMTDCSADGRSIAAARGQQLTLFARNATVLWRDDLDSDTVDLALSSDGTRLVVADLPGRVHFFNADGTLRATVDTRGDPDDDEKNDHRSWISDIALSEKGTYAAVISSRGLFYYTGNGRKLWAHEDELEGGTAVAVSGTGDEIAAASDAGVRLLNRTGALLWEYKSHRPVTALALSSNGSRVLAGSQDNTLICFDRGGEQLWTFTAGGWIRDVAVSENGSHVLAGSMDGQAYLFDGEGQVLKTYPLDGWVDHVALTADGTAGVAASSHEIIGFSTTVPVSLPAPAAEVQTTTVITTASPTTPTAVATTTAVPTAVPAPDPKEGVGLPLLLVGLLIGGVVLGAGYLHRRRSSLPEVRVVEEGSERSASSTEIPLVLEEEEPVASWEAFMEQGKTREAAQIISQQMLVLVGVRTGAHIFTTADALDACPGQRHDLAAFFAAADRLGYALEPPDVREVEALAAAYLHIAERMG